MTFALNQKLFLSRARLIVFSINFLAFMKKIMYPQFLISISFSCVAFRLKSWYFRLSFSSFVEKKKSRDIKSFEEHNKCLSSENLLVVITMTPVKYIFSRTHLLMVHSLVVMQRISCRKIFIFYLELDLNSFNQTSFLDISSFIINNF